MKKATKGVMGIALVLLLLLGLAAVCLALGAPARFVGPIYDGPELDYQPSIIRVEPSGQLMVVFERISLSNFFGDLYVTFSDDSGQTWTTPQPIIDSSLNERHPSLLRLAEDSFVLFYLVDESGSGAYRIYRATSSDGVNWTRDTDSLDLGWATAGEINPNVIREVDGTLTMTYHRLSGPSYIAQSHDGGVTWDTLRTQISPSNAQLPRLTKRESDGLYLVTYQVGSSSLDIFCKVSTDPYDWSGPEYPFSTAINSHDSQPIALEDGTFVVPYAQQRGSVFDVYYRTSPDGTAWSDEVQVTSDILHYDTQPHPLRHGAPGHIILTWSHQKSASPYQDHDVWIDTDLLVAPSFPAASKSVSAAVFAPELEPLTYTVRLPNTGLTATVALVDPIPDGTVYTSGSVRASSGDYGYDTAREVVTWTGTISTSAAVTLTFQVTPTASLADGEIVTNTAWFTPDLGRPYTLVVTATTDALPAASAISDPQDGQIISDTEYLIGGVAADAVSGVHHVSVSFDGGPWKAAAGQEEWTYSWEGLSDGEHSLRSRAVDKVGHVEAPGPGITVTVDTLPPELATHSPADGAVGAPLSTTVVLTFSEPIVPDTLAYTVAPDPGGWSTLWNAEDTVATLTHDDFDLSQAYTFSVDGARDQALNPIVPTQWSFATVLDDTLYRAYLPIIRKNHE
jgi:uncharacterized repeat protein (TIGR01451 family)